MVRLYAFNDQSMDYCNDTLNNKANLNRNYPEDMPLENLYIVAILYYTDFLLINFHN